MFQLNVNWHWGMRWRPLLGDLVFLSSPFPLSASSSIQQTKVLVHGHRRRGLLNPVHSKASVIHILVCGYEYIMVLNDRM